MKNFSLLPLRIWRTLAFAVWYAWQLVLANVVVARYVIGPRHAITPGIAQIPLRLQEENHVALLIGLVALTPGTLVLDVSIPSSELFVHGLHAPHRDPLRRQVQELERRLMMVLDVKVRDDH